jgi:hypothetical protein
MTPPHPADTVPIEAVRYASSTAPDAPPRASALEASEWGTAAITPDATLDPPRAHVSLGGGAPLVWARRTQQASGRPR